MRIARGMRVSPAVKVAAVATAVIAAVYVISAIVLNLVVAAHLTGQNDQRLAGRLAMARQNPAAVSQRITASGGNGDDDGDLDADSAPVFLWSVNATRAITAHTPGAPALPASVLAGPALHDGPAPRDGLTVTATLPSAGPFRLELTPDGGNWLVAGQSLAGDRHTQRLLLNGEIIAGPFVLLTLFFGLLVVGLRSLAPVEQSRRRQLEFTADASHELRTPLSVIRAEADVALSASRDAAQYRDALTRIQGESERLRQLVDDMLWLARFDSRPPPPGDEPVDLVTLAQVCADRFRAVGPDVSAETSEGPVLISAPPEWIDRLAGVLIDNACRYAGPGGQVRIQVRSEGNRVTLIVEDNGPGIPEADRPHLFDRFHRATEPASAGRGHGSGAGLGLAIGDSIVRSTGGRWHVGDSPLGGALFSVSWRHSQPHRITAPRATATSP
jgi:signal transduction histidine kinase